MSAKSLRKEREIESRRSEVLAAAIDLFVEKGYDQTSMAQIAERADFAVGTLYTLFKDKEELFRRLLHDGVADAEQALSAALDRPGNEIERLKQYIDTKVNHFMEHSAQAKFYFTEMSRNVLIPVAEADREVQALVHRLLDKVESTIREAMDKGLIMEADPHLLAVGLEGLTNAYLTEVIERPGVVPEEEIAGIIKQILSERVFLPPPLAPNSTADS